MNVLITGGSKGIGLAIARAYAKPGNALFINYLHDDAAAEAAAEAIRTAGADVRTVKSDAGSIAGCRTLIDAVSTTVRSARSASSVPS